MPFSIDTNPLIDTKEKCKACGFKGRMISDYHESWNSESETFLFLGTEVIYANMLAERITTWACPICSTIRIYRNEN